MSVDVLIFFNVSLHEQRFLMLNQQYIPRENLLMFVSLFIYYWIWFVEINLMNFYMYMTGSKLVLLFFFIFCYTLFFDLCGYYFDCVCARAHACSQVRGPCAHSHRTTCRSRFSPFTLWVSGLRLWWSDLTAGILTVKAISLAHFL